jgi:hypothetical protein
MMSQPLRTRSKSLICLPLLLMFLVNLAVHAQTSSAPLEPCAFDSDALSFLTELFARYTRATL